VTLAVTILISAVVFPDVGADDVRQAAEAAFAGRTWLAGVGALVRAVVEWYGRKLTWVLDHHTRFVAAQPWR